MRYPPPLVPGAAIGVCAPSSGVQPSQWPRLDRAIAHLRALGYEVIETPCVRNQAKCVSADAATRAAEFISLWEHPAVAAIIPPWGGEFLMELLPLLDWERLAALPPKWLSGYSDTTTLSLAITTRLGIATIHGAALMNMGFREIHPSDLRVFEAMAQPGLRQQGAQYYGGFVSWTDFDGPVYHLDQPGVWRSLDGKAHVFEGRMIGGCLDTICKLIGTQYAPVTEFAQSQPLIWAFESCEMNAADIYRTLWQMRACGWFQRCAGVLFGRPDGYSDTQDFALEDALRSIFGCPVLTGCDIGHIPPQMQLINGAWARVDYADAHATVWQEKR